MIDKQAYRELLIHTVQLSDNQTDDARAGHKGLQLLATAKISIADIAISELLPQKKFLFVANDLVIG